MWSGFWSGSTTAGAAWPCVYERLGDGYRRHRRAGRDRGLPLEAYPGVDSVVPILKPYKLVSREFRRTTGHHGRRDQFGRRPRGRSLPGHARLRRASSCWRPPWPPRMAGATMLRGGAYKPRTSPYAFQGLGVEGLEILAEARELTGLPVVTELMDPRHLEDVAKYSDVIQIGARNMQNFLLLSAVGQVDRPVLLKRGLAATIDELLMAAEYIVKEGNVNVILCERGIRTFEVATRNTSGYFGGARSSSSAATCR